MKRQWLGHEWWSTRLKVRVSAPVRNSATHSQTAWNCGDLCKPVQSKRVAEGSFTLLSDLVSRDEREQLDRVGRSCAQLARPCDISKQVANVRR